MWVFVGFLSDSLLVPPSHCTLSTCAVANVFRPFVVVLRPTLAASAFGARSPER